MDKNEPILTISIAAKLLKLHPRTLMLYEKEKLTTPHRTQTKRRLFSVNDLDELQFVKHLTQEERLNLQAVRLVKRAIKLLEEKNIDLKKLLFPTFKPKKLI